VRKFADIDLRTRGTRSRVQRVQQPALVIGDPTVMPPTNGGPFAGTVAFHHPVIARQHQC
jgi:hypothetical protein